MKQIDVRPSKGAVMPSSQHPPPPYFLTVRVGPTGGKFWEVAWRHKTAEGTTRNVKRRLGTAHVERRQGSDDWHRPRSKTPPGALDDRQAHVEASAVVARVTAELAEAENRGADGAASPATFREVTRAFLRYERDIKGLRPSTLRDYENVLAEPGTPHRRGKGSSPGHVMAALGDFDATAVSVADVNHVLSTVAESGAGASTVNKYRRVLSSIFGWASKASTYDLQANPATDADRRREPPRTPLDFLSVDEVEALAKALVDGLHRSPDVTLSAETRTFMACADRQDAELVRISAYTGLRRGELFALQWGDVSPTYDRLVLRRVLSNETEVPGTKSGKIREVPLADPAAAALRRLRERGDFTADTEYVAVSPDGSRLDASAFRRRVLAARDAIGLRPVRLHDLRHSFGSLLIAGGVDLVTVKAAYGHSTITTTERYLHARPAAEQAARFTAAFAANASVGRSADADRMERLLIWRRFCQVGRGDRRPAGGRVGVVGGPGRRARWSALPV